MISTTAQVEQEPERSPWELPELPMTDWERRAFEHLDLLDSRRIGPLAAGVAVLAELPENAQGLVEIATRTLAERVGCKETQARTILLSLRALGLLERVRSSREPGVPSTYRRTLALAPPRLATKRERRRRGTRVRVLRTAALIRRDNVAYQAGGMPWGAALVKSAILRGNLTITGIARVTGLRRGSVYPHMPRLDPLPDPGAKSVYHGRDRKGETQGKLGKAHNELVREVAAIQAWCEVRSGRWESTRTHQGRIARAAELLANRIEVPVYPKRNENWGADPTHPILGLLDACHDAAVESVFRGEGIPPEYRAEVARLEALYEAEVGPPEIIEPVPRQRWIYEVRVWVRHNLLAQIADREAEVLNVGRVAEVRDRRYIVHRLHREAYRQAYPHIWGKAA